MSQATFLVSAALPTEDRTRFLQAADGGMCHPMKKIFTFGAGQALWEKAFFPLALRLGPRVALLSLRYLSCRNVPPCLPAPHRAAPGRPAAGATHGYSAPGSDTGCQEDKEEAQGPGVLSPSPGRLLRVSSKSRASWEPWLVPHPS